MKRKGSTARYSQIVDGVWFQIESHNRFRCCDCGLVHLAEFRIRDAPKRKHTVKLTTRWTRDDRATRRQRQRYGIQVKQRRIR